jgi:hypothetical protein
MAQSIKIKFLADRIVRDHNGDIEARYRAGDVREISMSSARHWLNRGLAETIGVPAGEAEVVIPAAFTAEHKGGGKWSVIENATGAVVESGLKKADAKAAADGRNVEAAG